MNLRIPGPTPLPDNVIAAMGQQMINHRGPAFEAMHAEIIGWLKTFFETENEIYLLTSSGTGGMETGIVNTLSPGDRVLSVAGGVFGERFAKIAEVYGADVTRLSHKMGTAAKPEEVASIIREQGPFKAVTLTQNETSTGVLNDIGALAAAIHEAQDPSPLILVDGISGLGAIPLQMDAWGIDFVTTGSQKAWMSPPGIAMVSMGPRAWEAYETAKCPRFYFDLGLAKRYALKNQTPTTPSVQTVFALHTALADMIQEGPQAIAERHEAISAHCRARALEIGLGLYAEPSHFSPTVTAVTLAEGMVTADVLKTLEEKYDIVAGASKDPNVDMIRLGHMGFVSIAEIDEVFDALAEIMAS